MDGRIRPFRQGELDSLCGIYSVINAARILCPEIDRDIATLLFDVLVESLSWSDVGADDALSSGLEAASLSLLVETARGFVRDTLDIRLKAKPLALETKRPSLGDLWSALRTELGDRRVAILGLSGRFDHWTVGYEITRKRIELADSDCMTVLLRSHCSLEKQPACYRLKPAEIVILRRKGRGKWRVTRSTMGRR